MKTTELMKINREKFHNTDSRELEKHLNPTILFKTSPGSALEVDEVSELFESIESFEFIEISISSELSESESVEWLAVKSSKNGFASRYEKTFAIFVLLMIFVSFP